MCEFVLCINNDRLYKQCVQSICVMRVNVWVMTAEMKHVNSTSSNSSSPRLVSRLSIKQYIATHKRSHTHFVSFSSTHKRTQIYFVNIKQHHVLDSCFLQCAIRLTAILHFVQYCVLTFDFSGTWHADMYGVSIFWCFQLSFLKYRLNAYKDDRATTERNVIYCGFILENSHPAH